MIDKKRTLNEFFRFLRFYHSGSPEFTLTLYFVNGDTVKLRVNVDQRSKGLRIVRE